ncbi:MAG: cation transporter [Sulfurimonas sp.]|nr:cation transporter [Sulfurimonas sp.]
MNKKILLKIVLSLGLLLAFSACCDSKDEEKEAVKIDNTKVLKMVLNVQGMTCEGCEATIQNNVSKLAGVVSVKASHVDKTTTVDFDTTQISAAQIEKVIIETGYKIISTPEGSDENESPKVAPKSVMKCGEGKCGHAE